MTRSKLNKTTRQTIPKRDSRAPVLFILSIENFSESVEGSGYKQMTPELENKAFSAKSTQHIGLKWHKEEPYINHSLDEVCSS